MPLYEDGLERIREQLERIEHGERVPVIAIGCLTEEQHSAILRFRREQGLEGGDSPEILYLGRHHYFSRTKDGYTIDDMVLQVSAALHCEAIPVLGQRMTSMKASFPRDDGYGRMVIDTAVFELAARKPRVELYSVIPKGDGR